MSNAFVVELDRDGVRVVRLGAETCSFWEALDGTWKVRHEGTGTAVGLGLPTANDAIECAKAYLALLATLAAERAAR